MPRARSALSWQCGLCFGCLILGICLIIVSLFFTDYAELFITFLAIGLLVVCCGVTLDCCCMKRRGTLFCMSLLPSFDLGGGDGAQQPIRHAHAHTHTTTTIEGRAAYAGDVNLAALSL